LRRLVKKWCEETDSWKRNDWINFLKDRFETQKKSKWTRLMYPSLQKYTYEELDSYPVTDEWPIYPSAFPAATQWFSTGTVKRKLIKVTKEDILHIIKGVGRLGHKHIMTEIIEKELLLHWGEEFASGNLMKLQAIWSVKKPLLLNTLKIEKEIEKLKKMAPFDTISASTVASIVLLLMKIDFQILKEGGILVSTGDLLSPSIKKLIYERMKELGTTIFKIYDFYGSSETVMIAGGFVTEREHKLTYFPDIVSLRLMKSNGEIIDIFKAKKGDIGLALPTILNTLVVPNYHLGDIIEVLDPGNGHEMPKIRVLGRESFKIDKEHPDLGQLTGFSGAYIKVYGIPINTYALDDLFAKKLKMRYLSTIELGRGKGRLLIYTENKISEATLLDLFSSIGELHPLYLLCRSGLIEMEVVPDKEIVEKYEKLFLGEPTKPYLPRVIVKTQN